MIAQIALDPLPPVIPIVEQPQSPVRPSQQMVKQLEQRQEVAELREQRREQQASPDLIDYDIFEGDDEAFDDYNDPDVEDGQQAGAELLQAEASPQEEVVLNEEAVLEDQVL